MDPPFCVKYLNESEVEYELRLRNVKASRKTIETKRLILENFLKKTSVDVLSLKDPSFNRDTEKTSIENTIVELDALVRDFSASKDDTSYQLISTRLICLTNRVHRFTVPNEPEEANLTFSEFKDDAVASCLEIEAKLELKVIPKNTNLSQSLNNPTVKSIPVYKWGIQYDGKTSLKAFLERVTELSSARNVTEVELFNSAIDLFTGQALIWYRAARSKVTTWQDLVSQLELAFLPPEYDEQLLSEIKSRKQGHSETISVFVAIMQNLFNRLSTRLSEIEQLKIIRRNILPKYVNALALQDIKNTLQLITLCKKIDEATQINNSNHQPMARCSLLESDLACLDAPGPSKPKNKNFSSKTNSNKNNVIHNKQKNAGSNLTNNAVSPVTCWNCQKTGHVYSSCKESRKKFCFTCGKLNFTSRTCPTCKPKN